MCFQPNSQVSTYPRGVEVPYSSRPWPPVTAGEFRHALPIKGPKKWNPATFHRAQSAVSWRSGILVKHREQNRDRFGILIRRTAHHNVLEPLTAHPPVPVAAPRGPSSDSAQIMAPAASVRVPVRHLLLLAASLACCRAWEQVGVLPKRWQPPPAACAPSLVPVPVPVAHWWVASPPCHTLHFLLLLQAAAQTTVLNALTAAAAGSAAAGSAAAGKNRRLAATAPGGNRLGSSASASGSGGIPQAVVDAYNPAYRAGVEAAASGSTPPLPRPRPRPPPGLPRRPPPPSMPAFAAAHYKKVPACCACVRV